MAYMDLSQLALLFIVVVPRVVTVETSGTSWGPFVPDSSTSTLDEVAHRSSLISAARDCIRCPKR